jgi:hypothetical protein
MRFVLRRDLLLLVAGAAPAAAQTGTWLVTDREAALAASTDASGTRAVTRGPAIRYIAPLDATVPARQPFWLRVEFAARGGSRIIPDSIRITLLRSANIDLTPRLRPFLTEGALDMPEALAPRGRYALRVAVSDAQGRASDAVIQLNVG